MNPPGTGLTYASAGVSIGAADAAVDAMRDLVASTQERPEVLGSIGGFGGLFALPAGYREPVLVSSTDGVGTKLAVAMATGRFETVGIDLVAMCVDDLVCCGAEPLFLLDYQLLGRVDPDQVRSVMTGIAEGCRRARCAILGGELAEHPGLLAPGEIDLAGFAVGIVERAALIEGPSRCRAGDVLVGLTSPGLRSNGYSLARRALIDVAARDLGGPAWDGAAHSLADELLRPSVVYAPAVLACIRAVGTPAGGPGAVGPGAGGTPAGGPGAGGTPAGGVHAVAHITGGGLPANLPRVLPPDLDAVVDLASFERPRIFEEVRLAGGVAEEEMRRVFNLGIGMVLALDEEDLDVALAAISGALGASPAGGTGPLAAGSVAPGGGPEALVIGRLVAGEGRVVFTGTPRAQPSPAGSEGAGR